MPWASVSPEDVTVHVKQQIVDGRVWAAPTLVGTRLYLRNRTHVYCFELG